MKAPSIGRLIEDMITAARSRGGEARGPVLIAAASASVMMGAPDELRCQILSEIADKQAPTSTWLKHLWVAETNAFMFLHGHLQPVLEVLDNPDREADIRKVLRVLAEVDLRTVIETPEVGGDWLGRVYSAVTAPADRKHRGAFYTPAGVGSLIAELVGVREGESVYEPAVGCGGLVLAAVRAMRRRGQRPEFVTWTLGDIDRTALALAGVAMASYGICTVRLVPGDALAAPGMSSVTRG